MNERIRNGVRTLAARTFGAFGLEVHLRRTIRTGLDEVLDHVRKLEFDPRTVVDVGVGEGTPELYQAFPKATHLLVEPLREFEPHMKRITSRYDARYVLAAAGNQEGTQVINVHEDLTSSSLLHEVEGRAVDGAPRSVPVVTLDAVCKQMRLVGPYLIKIDVQGAELLVLAGTINVLRETEVVALEASLFRFFEGGPELAEVVGHMKERGFVIYDIYGGHLRPLDGALAQVDLVFVREDGPFRGSHSYASRAQRIARGRRD